MKNIAVILAGGAGKRFGADRPKQLLPMEDGRSVLAHAVEAFEKVESIDQILVVMHPDWIEDKVLLPLKEKGVLFVAGGKERWESSWNAIRAVIGTSYTSSSSKTSSPSEASINILLHDAARPYVSARIIEDVCRALETHEAVTVAVPATDTMYCVETPTASRQSRDSLATVTRGLSVGRPWVVAIPDRATMMRAQTPQAFRLELIKRAYERAVQDPNLQATDDCGIVHKYLPDTPIYIVEGEEANRKITFREDLG